MQYTINDAFNLFKDRAGTRGVSSNVSPVKFNRWWGSAELKFFNQMYDIYARKQTISDSISKWMTDPLYLPIDANGRFTFFPGMNLLHVDSMSNYFHSTLGIGTLNTLVSGSGYNSGTYTIVPLTGGTGTGAYATIIVGPSGGVSSVTITQQGYGYLVNDVLSANIFAGSGFTIKVATLSGSSIATLGTLVPGTAYTSGNYNVSLTGGTGTGATAFITVGSTGTVISVLPLIQGSGYVVGDTLSATLPVGSGFTINVATLTGATADNPITRVEKQLVAANLSSTYDSPNQQFPIYTQYSNSFQFYPKNMGFAKTVFLQQPIWSFWAYHLQGYIATLTGLIGGSSYTNGTYTNVPLTGGLGNSALATVTVAGNVVTSVVITNPGKIYAVGDVLSAANGNIGGTGTGFSINVSSLVQGSIRPIYDPTNSVQPRWNNDDISTIVDLALFDASINARDKELAGFATAASKSQQ